MKERIITMEKLHKGIYKLTFGEPEQHTATTYKIFSAKDETLNTLLDTPLPFDINQAEFKQTPAGCVLKLPISGNEEIYGFGLQLKGFKHTGSKKHIRPNADPLSNSGDSHAPVPYYVSTNGYAVLVDTARYASFYCGHTHPKGTGKSVVDEMNKNPAPTDEILYAAQVKDRQRAKMLIEIPVAKGVDIYIFAGENMLEAVQKYNLFSGGGPTIPEWALGVWYRSFTRSSSDDWLRLAKGFKEKDIPCSVFGLEPGWQSEAYPCSYVWDEKRGKRYKEFLDLAQEQGFKVNLWEHAFVHPSSPVYEEMLPASGDYDVWKGLVPDFATKEARNAFTKHHKKLVAEGISGFKLDECDGSDFTNGWSFPNSAEFPSGLDGEQMHSLFGMLYMQVIHSLFQEPAVHLVRNAHAFAAPYPFVLYSDLYGHKDYIRGMANMGFSGHLWTPEVRIAADVKDYIRRLQTVLLSPLMQVDAWFIPNPPWFQIDRTKNNAGEEMANSEEVTNMTRDLFKLRERLIPMLKEAFDKYSTKGLPPFRALVLDYPADKETYEIEDQYMIGDSFMAAPLTAESDTRKFYVPEGEWMLFGTSETFTPGWHQRDFALEEIPLFEKTFTKWKLS